MIRSKPPKPKTCKVCRELFPPVKPMQKACSVSCALALAKSTRAKEEKRAQVKERAADRAKRESLKPISYWEKKAEAAVNKYVRLRDYAEGCISCHLPANWNGQWHASHFRSVGAASAVRFNLWNIHKACSVCNKWKSGNLAEYGPRIVEKIGADKVDWLKTQNQIVRYSREYLERLARVFNKKASRQEKRNGR